MTFRRRTANHTSALVGAIVSRQPITGAQDLAVANRIPDCILSPPKQDKLRYEREMKNYIPPKGEKQRRFKDPNAPKRPPSTFFIFCGDYRPKIKGENPGLSIGDIAKKLGEMWNSSSAEVKQPYEKKAAKLKEKYDKDIALYRTKGIAGLSKKDGGEDDDEDENEEEEEEEEEDDEEEDE
ncbi:high mobility group protein B1-like [Sinocyclocheilus rhinocerous]|uniref:high mobility group protein B1-like n=1 Tax=Sinocyclocheilus rhinocerous TaxID=307959 RepID=UPI0007B963E7|nr:PREDICTED: high mobility group protein B1-like [Sinocyclocheilus rhinocerous]